MKNTQYLSSYTSILKSKIPAEIRTELEEIFTATKGFTASESSNNATKARYENFKELYSIIESAFPDAIKKKSRKEAISEVQKLKKIKSTRSKTKPAPQKEPVKKAEAKKTEKPKKATAPKKVKQVTKTYNKAPAKSSVKKDSSESKLKAKKALLADLKSKSDKLRSQLKSNDKFLAKINQDVSSYMKANGLAGVSIDDQIKAEKQRVKLLSRLASSDKSKIKSIRKKTGYGSIPLAGTKRKSCNCGCSGKGKRK